MWATTGLERAAVGKVTMKVERGPHRSRHREGRAGDGRRCARPPALQVLPGDRRGAVPLVSRRADRREADGARRARRADAPPPPLLRRTRCACCGRSPRQAGGIIVQARLMESLESKEKERQEYRRAWSTRSAACTPTRPPTTGAPRGAKRRPGQHRLTGLGASPGFGVGRAHLLHPEVTLDHVEHRERRRSGRRARARSSHAVERSVEEMVRLKEKMHTVAPEIDGAIFDAQRMMLEDASFLGKIETPPRRRARRRERAQAGRRRVRRRVPRRVATATCASAPPTCATSASACCATCSGTRSASAASRPTSCWWRTISRSPISRSSSTIT